MHPILAHGRRLSLYVVLSLLVGSLLSVLLLGQDALTFPQAALIAVPLSTLYAFICLSAWYVAWSQPLATTGALRIIFAGLAAAVLSSGGWLLADRESTRLKSSHLVIS